jgi:hypothetical protein
MRGSTDVSPLLAISAFVIRETVFGTRLRSASVCVAVTTIGSSMYVLAESGGDWQRHIAGNRPAIRKNAGLDVHC